MYLEIVSPEATLLSSDVDVVTLPGPDGEFQLLNYHAAIVSTLSEGTIKIKLSNQSNIVKDGLHASVIQSPSEANTLTIKITSGTVEMKNNKVIILVD